MILAPFVFQQIFFVQVKLVTEPQQEDQVDDEQPLEMNIDLYKVEQDHHQKQRS